MSELTTYAHHMGCILKVLVYIESHLDEELSLEKMAKMACISPFYFHRLFHAYIGETLAEHVKRLRLIRAQERLQYSSTPITEIALDLGYESPSSFAKVFQQVMGQSPREYRKAMQPLIQAIMERTLRPSKDMLQVEYIFRKPETVLFVRRVGDYLKTPWAAFEALCQFLERKLITEENIKAYYSMGLDDPHIVKRSQCRFDVCVALKSGIPPEGEIGQKILPGGRFAVFIHRGPYSKIEEAFESIFRFWYPTSKVELSDESPFCEPLNVNAPPCMEKITKLYIPLK